MWHIDITSGRMVTNMIPDKRITVPLLLLIIGEVLIFNGLVVQGMAVYIFNLSILYILIIRGGDDNEVALMQRLLLLPLFRIMIIAMPLSVSSTRLNWYLLVGCAMLPAIYIATKTGRLGYAKPEVNKVALKYIPAAIVLGSLLGIVERRILNPVPLLSEAGIAHVLIFISIMLFIASVDEIIFRSLIQTAFEEFYGMHHALLVTAVLYGIMHSGYGNGSEIAFGTFSGLILGYVFQKTRSLPLVVLIHSFEGVFLFSCLFS